MEPQEVTRGAGREGEGRLKGRKEDGEERDRAKGEEPRDRRVWTLGSREKTA